LALTKLPNQDSISGEQFFLAGFKRLSFHKVQFS